MDIEKLQYFTLGADVIEKKCEGITFVFTTLNNTDQVVGTLFADNGDPLALRMRTVDGNVHKIQIPVDIYPSLGLVTHRNAYAITTGKLGT